MTPDPESNPDAIARALAARDFATAGRGLAELPQARWGEVAERLSPDLRASLSEEAWEAAWAQVGRAEALGPELMTHPDAAPLRTIVSALGRLIEAAEAGRDAPRARRALEEAVQEMQAVAERASRLRQAHAAELAAAAGDVGFAAREAGAVLRAHQQAPCPKAAALAAWVLAGLARDRGRVDAEKHALVACAAAARRCGDDERLAAAMRRLEELVGSASEG